MATPKASPATSEPPAEYPLLTYIDGLVEGLRGHVPGALKDWDSEAVHGARVATRRLKAALDLLRPVLSKGRRKPFGKVLRKLRRRLGPLRDIDVMLGHMGELEEAGRPPLAVAWIEAALREDRDEARKRSSGKTSTPDVLGKLGTWWGLREEVVEANEAVGHLLAESLHLQTDAFAEQADRMAAPDDTAGNSARPDPHQIRIAGKALRYTLEMAAVEGHPIPPGVTRTFKKMQETLGLWHDFVVLTERAMKGSVDERLAHHDAATQEQVLELARLSLRRASHQLEKFAKLWQREGTELVRIVRASFPLTVSADAKPTDVTPIDPAPDVSGSKTGPDHSGSATPEDPAPPDRADASGV